MVRKVSLILFVAALSLAVAIPVALADQPEHVGGGLGNSQPNFGPSLWADGDVWGTKGTTTLPAPTGNNLQSFDRLFVIVNGADDGYAASGQLPVGEAAPGNRMYNGGRWVTYTVEWTSGTPEVLKSYDDISAHMEHLSITLGSPEGGPPAYFQCPLLPVLQ
jgi:hypothetical protein